MTKTKHRIAASASCFLFLAAAVACNDRFDEVGLPADASGSDVIGMQLEEPVTDGATKLNLKQGSDGTFEMVWGDGDEITVVGTSSTKFTLSSGSGTSKGRFTGNMADAGEGPYYAVFPYKEQASFDGKKLTFQVPQEKGAQNGNLASKTMQCVAEVGSDGSVYAGMHNVLGLLKISLTASPSVVIKKITLHDLGGNMLWGDCTVPVNADGTLDYEHITLENGTNSISMVWNGSATISTSAKTFFFPVPPGSLDRGFSLVLYKKDSSREGEIGEAYSIIQKISSPVTAKRSVIIQMDNASIKQNGESADVMRRGYYKSLFVDAGMFLSNIYTTSGIPAIPYMGLSEDYEYITSHTTSELKGSARTTDSLIQRNVMVKAEGSAPEIKWKDSNGCLVYPDGSPRFRLIYANGGRSYDHGRSLGKEGRDRVHNFFMNGGSYSGSCAGSFLAATWVDGTKRYGNSNASSDWSFGLFPGELVHTHLPPSTTTYPESVLTGMTVLPALKKLGYYNFASVDTLEDVRHHGGSYFPHNARNAAYKVDELMSFRYSERSLATSHRYNPDNTSNEVRYNNKFIQIVDSLNTWAYKKNSSSGRLVVTGSHPEKGVCGNMRDFTAMMYSYAMDGNGLPKVKGGNLRRGVTRKMDKTTEDEDPDYTRIGDKQYHHFRFVASEPLEDVQLTLSSQYGADSGIDLFLSLRKDDLAWISDADYVIGTKGGNKTLNIKSLPAGTWYVGVYCNTTVTSTKTGSSPTYYFSYSGHTEVLDGIPYSILLTSSAETKSDIPSGTLDE